MSAGLLSSGNAECLGCIVQISDISALKKTEASLRESESQLRALGNNLPEGAIYRLRQESNGRFHFEFISTGMESLTGVPMEEMMRNPWAAFRTIQREDFKRVMDAFALSREQLTRFEIEVCHNVPPTGEERCSLLRASPSRQPDGSTVWDGIQLDITERKRAVDALRESERRLGFALEGGQMGM